MTESRVYKRGNRVDLPAHWLQTPWWDSLPMALRGLYVSAMMWSQGQGTDGVIPRSALRLLSPDALEVLADGMDRLCQLLPDRVVRTADGWQFLGWQTTHEQSSAQQIENYREGNKRRQREYRASQRGGFGTVTRDGMRDGIDDVTDDVGKERPGEERPEDAVRAQPKAEAMCEHNEPFGWCCRREPGDRPGASGKVAEGH